MARRPRRLLERDAWLRAALSQASVQIIKK
jgi:hypothetical protein